MGFGRRIVRKSVWRVAPRPVRKAMHPARIVRNAVTLRAVKQVSRAAYIARYPVGAAENAAIGAMLYPPGARRGFWARLFGASRRTSHRQGPRSSQHHRHHSTGHVPRESPVRTSQPPVQARPQPRPVVPQRRAQPSRPRVEPWPARKAFRGQRPKLPDALPMSDHPFTHPQSAGEAEIQPRLGGWGDGSHLRRKPRNDSQR